MEVTKQTITIGSNSYDFILAYNPENDLPSWVTIMDESWLNDAGESMYNFFQDHLIQLSKSNLENKKDFAVKINMHAFKNSIMLGKILNIREMIIKLYNSIKTNSPENVYICFFSNTDKPYYISAMITEYGENVMLNVKLTEVSL